MLATHSTWQTRHVSRMYNRQAHYAAQWAVDNDFPCGYILNPQLPLQLSVIVGGLLVIYLLWLMKS